MWHLETSQLAMQGMTIFVLLPKPWNCEIRFGWFVFLICLVSLKINGYDECKSENLEKWSLNFSCWRISKHMTHKWLIFIYVMYTPFVFLNSWIQFVFAIIELVTVCNVCFGMCVLHTALPLVIEGESNLLYILLLWHCSWRRSRAKTLHRKFMTFIFFSTHQTRTQTIPLFGQVIVRGVPDSVTRDDQNKESTNVRNVLNTCRHLNHEREKAWRLKSCDVLSGADLDCVSPQFWCFFDASRSCQK